MWEWFKFYVQLADKQDPGKIEVKSMWDVSATLGAALAFGLGWACLFFLVLTGS